MIPGVAGPMVPSLPAILNTLSNTLSGNVSLNNTSNYFDGPSVAQGSSGTWFAVGTVTVQDTGGTAAFDVKLWDGTTVIASAQVLSTANVPVAVSVSGVLTNPVGNLRISVKDQSNATGLIIANGSGAAADSTITAIRIA